MDSILRLFSLSNLTGNSDNLDKHHGSLRLQICIAGHFHNRRLSFAQNLTCNWMNMFKLSKAIPFSLSKKKEGYRSYAKTDQVKGRFKQNLPHLPNSCVTLGNRDLLY